LLFYGFKEVAFIKEVESGAKPDQAKKQGRRYLRLFQMGRFIPTQRKGSAKHFKRILTRTSPVIEITKFSILVTLSSYLLDPKHEAHGYLVKWSPNFSHIRDIARTQSFASRTLTLITISLNAGASSPLNVA